MVPRSDAITIDAAQCGHEEKVTLAHDASSITVDDVSKERAAKRLKSDASLDSTEMSSIEPSVPGQDLHDAPTNGATMAGNGRHGLASIKREYLVKTRAEMPESAISESQASKVNLNENDSKNAARGRPRDREERRRGGQNTQRSFGRFDDAIRLCNSRAFYSEFSPRNCRFGDSCSLCHDLREYLNNGRREDLGTFGGKCPVFEQHGHCPSGWKCRFVKSHMQEIEHQDGRKELVLLGSKNPVQRVESGKRESQVSGPDESDKVEANKASHEEMKMEQHVEHKQDGHEEAMNGITGPNDSSGNGEDCNPVAQENESSTHGGDSNSVAQDSEARDKRHVKTKDTHRASQEPEDARPGVYNVISMSKKTSLSRKRFDFAKADEYIQWMNQEAKTSTDINNRRKRQPFEETRDLQAQFVDPPFLASEKRRLYFGPETPTLAPLTTQGNLPFRRLCVELGCQLTYSEMAMGMPLLQGAKADWTLVKAHESEITPPRFTPSETSFVFDNYDNFHDVKFGVQISGNQPWIVTKSANVLSRFCPHLRLIDLNCGCPIDMIFKSGGGSALLESQSKMERMIRGMNAVSGEIPITAKMRTGVKGNRPVAVQLLGRLAFGGRENRSRLGAPGCAAVTLHGRSREQRYTKKADWGYIAECAAMIKMYNTKSDELCDTVNEADARSLPNAPQGHMYFLGNGDCYSHIDYFAHIEKAHVDSVMIGRGALIKPWIFEEIESGQYLDKTSSERLRYIEKFVRYGLDAWGSDEVGIGFTRRFLLEWLSFAHRYVPIGLLEHLPPSLNDRPPSYEGRDELETLMASTNYLDWIKISEMFLGPVHPGFKFQPKHKSNAYEAEG